MRALLLAGLLALPALAGCLSPAATTAEPPGLVSPVRFEDLLAEHAPIRSFDGTTLDAFVFRPDVGDSGETVPVIINFSPYWSNLAPPVATGGDAFSKYLIDHYVPRGYAVALVSARGTGLSEGCFSIGGPAELADEDVVATFFGTQPWSNGNVTATGKSYDGTMAQGLLTKANPHVKTIVPVSPISELYKYGWFDGVPYSFHGQVFNPYYVAIVSLAQGEDTRGQTPTRFCPEAVDVQASQVGSAATGDYSAYWRARNYTALLPERVDASVFYIHGLSDWNVKPDHMTPWIQALRARGVTVKMWLGDWAHDYPTRGDFNETLLRWLDHHLKGIDTGILDEPLVQVQSRDGLWRHEAEWPPARAETLTLYPTTGGGLADAPGTGAGMYADASRSGGVTYSYEVPRDLRIVGTPFLRVAVSSTGPRATLSATLLADGEVVGLGFRDLAHRDTLNETRPMVPGQRYEVDVHFYPQDVLVKAGTRLTLAVAHNEAGDAPVRSLPMPTGAVVTLHHGEGTRLHLPVLDALDVTPESPQPEDVGCWAC